MTRPLIDSADIMRRKQFQSRSGDGRIKQHGDGSKHVPAPPRNAPCPCGSGKKAKRCHPEGLKPVVRREIEKGTCSNCKAENVIVIPLKHEGLPGWEKHLCGKCLRDREVFKRMVAEAGLPTPAVTLMEAEDAREFAEEMRADSDRDLRAAEAHLHHEPVALTDGEP